MKRWLPWLVVPAGLCVAIFLSRATGDGLLEDTDTSALLARIQQVNNPLQWFAGDWPLQNHFYRPISTLTFEWDLARYGDAAAGYGTTNAVIAILCVLSLFWFVRELSDSPSFAGLSASLFALWHLAWPLLPFLQTALVWIAWLPLLGLVRGGRRHIWPCVLACLGLLFLSKQLAPVTEFSAEVIMWLPGRTASVMALFCLVAMSAYARFERFSARAADPAEATPDDVPKSKTAVVIDSPLRSRWTWLAVSIAAVALALGSYEQAIMLPALLVATAIYLRVNGLRPQWWVHGVFWAVLLGYVALRMQLVPMDASGYQQQQFRTGPGIWLDISRYTIPAGEWLFRVWDGWVGILLLLGSSFWSLVLLSAGNLTTFTAIAVSRERWRIAGFWLMAFAAYLPMAWLQVFGHYHYWPSALRAPFVVLLAGFVFKLVVSAASLPTVRAPARQRPAPGSLLRP